MISCQHASRVTIPSSAVSSARHSGPGADAGSGKSPNSATNLQLTGAAGISGARLGQPTHDIQHSVYGYAVLAADGDARRHGVQPFESGGYERGRAQLMLDVP